MAVDDTIFFDLTKAIIDRLVANWTTLPIVIQNDDATGITIANGFVRVYISHEFSDFASVNAGNPLSRTTGIINFDIHTPQNEQIGDGLTYAGQIATVFRGKTFLSVQCRMPSIDAKRNVEYSTNKYWLTPLICPFQYDKHVTIV